ncbi:hypothetical protein [Butyrivibrio sp. INlla21]|uniref:hypothetical protein n=1 Tax=Butyrivibrio sp. INlla21 TaxID=1520811 RepID=UPI000AB15642|nr:hypothetical protein [Butyrivibrio sp. INlla21]
MRVYQIYDEESQIDIGILLYYEKSKDYIIELRPELDEWTAPLLFTAFVKAGIYTIPRDASLMWVMERVIPVGRQNIGSILSTHKLKEYDEMALLELAGGRCSQDGLCIRRIEEVPEFVKERSEHNLVDCTALEGNLLLCFFVDKTVKKVSLNDISDHKKVDNVIANNDLYESCALGLGGYYVSFNDSIDIPAWLLYEKGRTVDVAYDDFLAFAKKNICDTTKACEILECTRQNLNYLVKKEGITPIMTGVKGNLYLKNELI